MRIFSFGCILHSHKSQFICKRIIEFFGYLKFSCRANMRVLSQYIAMLQQRMNHLPSYPRVSHFYSFRNLREMFKIDAADYMMSICGNDALRELSSPGKSGSVFFLSQDDRFMIKTLRKSEVKVNAYLSFHFILLPLSVLN